MNDPTLVRAFQGLGDLRLLAGVGDFELAAGEPWWVDHSPTSFGRIDLSLAPLDHFQGWRLSFARGVGPDPANVQLPAVLAERWRFDKITGAEVRRQGDILLVTPNAKAWEVLWKA